MNNYIIHDVAISQLTSKVYNFGCYLLVFNLMEIILGSYLQEIAILFVSGLNMPSNLRRMGWVYFQDVGKHAHWPASNYIFPENIILAKKINLS